MRDGQNRRVANKRIHGPGAATRLCSLLSTRNTELPRSAEQCKRQDKRNKFSHYQTPRKAGMRDEKESIQDAESFLSSLRPLPSSLRFRCCECHGSERRCDRAAQSI